ncbi:MAG: hypothetical protein A2908_02035 [Candidatus Staskawiczbacteria bacterium RIFCSPLOWO2_01_FULL_38_12b]|uniref:Uncharacterized protein n=1 Tax=Candidatus Staskawiczbacteria bacterium RIFCSPLOWO2_01_FULL_38_12b TaxID=1802214 RepID=A0A1G2IEZ6_9BACT|nr:MAG: hypothetical protein A2908_02035 [Candidatus Staskawiczbacteria bacterium RIFCSPLOWO2_01_FULL_38_12b]QBM02633.1 hypothetical protein [uncultured archaeon]
MDPRKDNKKITTINELAEMIRGSFQTAQEHVDGKFYKVDERFDKVENRLDKVEKDLKEVKEKVNGFIDTYHEEKLPMRMDYIENMLNVPKK